MISFKVKRKNSGYVNVDDLVVGDLVLCCDKLYHEVRSVISYSCSAYTITLSNFKRYTIPTLLQLKTVEGFKIPEQGDRILINRRLQPFVHEIQKELLNLLFCDILIDVPMISKEGIVFKREDCNDSGNKEAT